MKESDVIVEKYWHPESIQNTTVVMIHCPTGKSVTVTDVVGSIKARREAWARLSRLVHDNPPLKYVGFLGF